MPHILVEYADVPHIKERMEAVLDHVIDVARHSDILSLKHLKLRAVALQHFRVGENVQPFVHFTITMMEGPSLADREALSDALFDNLSSFLFDIEQVTVDLRLSTRSTYRKRLK